MFRSISSYGSRGLAGLRGGGGNIWSENRVHILSITVDTGAAWGGGGVGKLKHQITHVHVPD